MHMIIVKNECHIMSLGYAPGAAPKLVRPATVVCEEAQSLQVAAVRYYEAVDASGARVAAGRQFQLLANKGDKITFRRVKSPRSKFSKAEIAKARKKKTVTVVDQDRYDVGAFCFGASYTDGTLRKVIATLKAIEATIPAKFRASARCGIDSRGGYEGDHFAHIEVSYSRPETDAEVVERIQQEMIGAHLQQEAEQAEYERLKAKLLTKIDRT